MDHDRTSFSEVGVKPPPWSCRLLKELFQTLASEQVVVGAFILLCVKHEIQNEGSCCHYRVFRVMHVRAELGIESCLQVSGAERTIRLSNQNSSNYLGAFCIIPPFP